MPSSSILLLLSAAFSIVNALPWSGPQETKVYKEHEWSPAPTVVPVNPTELFKRSSVDVNICGWIGGNSKEPAVCSSGSSCIHDTIHGYVGCCTTDGPCTAGVYTSCMDKNSAGWSPNSGLADNGVYTCNGNDVCYRNTYPGGYYQYGCGSSNWATTVATTYSGQPSDLLLQVVYTGVNFTPTSAPTKTSTSTTSSSTASSSSSSASTSSSISSSATLGVSGMVTPTDPATNSTPSATAKSNTSKIVIASVGGTVAVAAILLLAFLLWRRRSNKKNKNYAGPFNSTHNRLNSEDPTSGPFQNVRPYGPDDFGSSMSVTPAPATHQYASIPGTHHANSQILLSQPNENAPLVTEDITDDYSRSYHNIFSGRDEDAGESHENISQLPDTVTGMGLGIGVARPLGLRRGGSGGSSEYSRETRETREVRALNRDPSARSFRTQNEGWEPQRLRTRTENGYTNGVNGTRDRRSGGNTSPEIDVPPRSPLREGRQGFKIPADNRPRYQLVDEVVGENVPILHSPGQLRQMKSARKE